MKKIITALTRPFVATYRFIRKIIRKIKRGFSPVATYTYTASDLFVRKIIKFYRKLAKSLKKHDQQKRFFYWYVIPFVTSVTIMLLLVFTISYYIFIVPVGASAVITRFGAYSREVSSGLNIVIPLVERYYIVQTGNLFEESFGFRQGPRLLYLERFNPQENYITQNYEAELLRSEKETNDPFSGKGSFLIEMNRRQRLTHDYLRQHFAPPQTLSTKNITESIRHKEQVIAEIKRSQVSLDGKIPVRSEMLFLTGDLGLIELQWVVQYRISNAKQYLFNSRDVSQNIHDICMSNMNKIVGETLFHKVMTLERGDVEEQVRIASQEVLDRYKIGITITRVIILNALPSTAVLFSFNEVNKATQDLERYRFQGELEFMKKIPKAYGEAAKIRSEAEAYALQVVNKAIGESGRFTLVNQAYQKAPDITAQRLYITTMETILQSTPNVIVEKNLEGVIPFIINSTQLTQSTPVSTKVPLESPSSIPSIPLTNITTTRTSNVPIH